MYIEVEITHTLTIDIGYYDNGVLNFFYLCLIFCLFHSLFFIYLFFSWLFYYVWVKVCYKRIT